MSNSATAPTPQAGGQTPSQAINLPEGAKILTALQLNGYRYTESHTPITPGALAKNKEKQ